MMERKGGDEVERSWLDKNDVATNGVCCQCDKRLNVGKQSRQPKMKMRTE